MQARGFAAYVLGFPCPIRQRGVSVISAQHPGGRVRAARAGRADFGVTCTKSNYPVIKRGKRTANLPELEFHTNCSSARPSSSVAFQSYRVKWQPHNSQCHPSCNTSARALKPWGPCCSYTGYGCENIHNKKEEFLQVKAGRLTGRINETQVWFYTLVKIWDIRILPSWWILTALQTRQEEHDQRTEAVSIQQCKRCLSQPLRPAAPGQQPRGGRTGSPEDGARHGALPRLLLPPEGTAVELQRSDWRRSLLFGAVTYKGLMEVPAVLSGLHIKPFLLRKATQRRQTARFLKCRITGCTGKAGAGRKQSSLTALRPLQQDSASTLMNEQGGWWGADGGRANISLARTASH